MNNRLSPSPLPSPHRGEGQKGNTIKIKRLTPIKAIRAKCLDCSAGQPSEIRNCQISDCPLYPFRLGKNPFSKRKGNIANLKPFPRKNDELSTGETENSGIVKDNLIPVLHEEK